MRINIRWRTTDPTLTASLLAGGVGSKVDIPLLPITNHSGYGGEQELQGLTFEVGGLSEEMSVPKEKGFGSRRNVAGTIHLIEHALIDYGVTGMFVEIDGHTPLHYAAQQEALADKCMVAIHEAAESLRQTGRWFKNRTLQDIRLGLERAVGKT